MGFDLATLFAGDVPKTIPTKAEKIKATSIGRRVFIKLIVTDCQTGFPI